MNSVLLYLIGFTAQLLFSIRLLIQWIYSEKQQQIATPSVFWKISLLASVLFFIYGFYRKDFAIMLGQILTYYIYIRNLQLQKEWQKASSFIRWILLLGPIILLLTSYLKGNFSWHKLLRNEDMPIWLATLGVVSQLVFSFRFLYQWRYSEKIKTSKLSVGFWQWSIAGALLILVYAIFRKDPVLCIAHASGLAIYIRNIILFKKAKNTIR